MVFGTAGGARRAGLAARPVRRGRVRPHGGHRRLQRLRAGRAAVVGAERDARPHHGVDPAVHPRHAADRCARRRRARHRDVTARRDHRVDGAGRAVPALVAHVTGGTRAHSRGTDRRAR